MADYFPFDNGPGSNVTEAQWNLMAKNWLGTGVIKGAINEFQVYADSTGMQAKVKSGQAWVEGFFFQVVTETVVPISAANATNPRIDRIAVQVDWTNNNISLIAIQGTPAASPTAPALTQNTSLWQMSLAQVYVGANVSTIAAGNITDERTFAGMNNPYVHINNNNPYSYGTTNGLLTCPINGNFIYNNGFTDNGDGTMSIKYDGTYFIDAMVNISGLNQGVNGILIVRHIYNGGSTDHVHSMQGPSGVGGNNGGIWIHHSLLKQLKVGDKLQFILQVGESPRTLMQTLVNAFRVSTI